MAETRGTGIHSELVKDGSLNLLFKKELWRV